MTINAQSGVGRIRLFEDFFGIGWMTLANTDDACPAGPFFIGGEGFEDNDAGAAYLQSDALSGVVRLTSANTDQDMTFIGTDKCFDVALMGTLVLETRVRFVDLDTKAAFIGFTSVLTLDEQIDDIIDYSAGTTITLTAGSLCGFFLSSELTDDEDWHMVYNGGTTTGETTSSNIDADDDAVAGEWQVLRLEIDNNGTARWYIDGVLKQTVAGAISTSTDVGVCVGVAANTTELSIMDVDYVLVEANRDWNA
jgi:hypothetical protein